jgi:hypothetical protein
MAPEQPFLARSVDALLDVVEAAETVMRGALETIDRLHGHGFEKWEDGDNYIALYDRLAALKSRGTRCR